MSWRSCAVAGLDTWEVIEVAATKSRLASCPLPGLPGLAATCIPVDPLYLSWKLRTLEIRSPLHRSRRPSEHRHAGSSSAASKTQLNDESQPLRGAHILVMGVAYRSATSTTSVESPALDIIEMLAQRVRIIATTTRVRPQPADRRPPVSQPAAGRPGPGAFSAVAILTDHSQIDYARLVRGRARDHRHAQRHAQCRPAATGSARIVRL